MKWLSVGRLIKHYISSILGKLADNSTVIVQLPELKEALALSIQEVGNIVKDY